MTTKTGPNDASGVIWAQSTCYVIYIYILFISFINMFFSCRLLITPAAICEYQELGPRYVFSFFSSFLLFSFFFHFIDVFLSVGHSLQLRAAGTRPKRRVSHRLSLLDLFFQFFSCFTDDSYSI